MFELNIAPQFQPTGDTFKENIVFISNTNINPSIYLKVYKTFNTNINKI